MQLSSHIARHAPWAPADAARGAMLTSSKLSSIHVVFAGGSVTVVHIQAD